MTSGLSVGIGLVPADAGRPVRRRRLQSRVGSNGCTRLVAAEAAGSVRHRGSLEVSRSCQWELPTNTMYVEGGLGAGGTPLILQNSGCQ